jgi:hypothetical protein
MLITGDHGLQVTQSSCGRLLASCSIHNIHVSNRHGTDFSLGSRLARWITSRITYARPTVLTMRVGCDTVSWLSPSGGLVLRPGRCGGLSP